MTHNITTQRFMKNKCITFYVVSTFLGLHRKIIVFEHKLCDADILKNLSLCDVVN